MALHHFAHRRTAGDAVLPPGPGLTRRQMLIGSLAAVGGVAAASALAGCAPSASASGLHELAYWHLLSGGDGINMAGLVDKVNALDHGYEATQTVLAWGAPYYTKLAMASVGGRSPDVAIMHASRVAGLRARRAAGPVGPGPAGRVRRRGVRLPRTRLGQGRAATASSTRSPSTRTRSS